MDYPIRKYPRLKTYDYANGGTFCVTICTRSKEHLLSRVVSIEDAYVELSSLGIIVQETILRIPIAYPGVDVLNWVIMPNHVHLLLQINKSKISLFSVIRSTKSIVSRQWGSPVWQRSFFEHVVRSEKDALRYWKYIDENPKKWVLDQYYGNSP